jgi:hypothetical protein
VKYWCIYFTVFCCIDSYLAIDAIANHEWLDACLSAFLALVCLFNAQNNWEEAKKREIKRPDH